MTNLFRVLHIFFASMTLALLPVAIIMLGKMKRTKGTPAELTTMSNLNLPASKKMTKLINERLAADGTGGATDEIRALGARIGAFAPIMNLLALAAMTLGASKGIF